MKREKTQVSCEEAVCFLQAIPPFGGKREDVENTRRLLELMGHPEKRFRMIHVAGTNGKGSCCAYLDSIFREAGFRTGLFTSPHLVRVNERIRVQGEEIPDEELAEAFCRVRDALRVLKQEGGQDLSYFEFLFALGLCWFEKAGIDLLVCETGLGGRLDPTNAIGRKDAAVITSISLDHTKLLGSTAAQIAGEKAGILRKGVPVIYCAKDPESACEIERRARELNAKRIPLTTDAYRITARTSDSTQVSLSTEGYGEISLQVPFRAEYQAENACLAALCALECGIGKEVIEAGIRNAHWPGRMQEIRKDVFLDGAHNPDGIRKLADEIRVFAKERPVWLVTAIAADKDYWTMVRELCRGISFEGVIATSVSGGRLLEAEALAGEFVRAGQRFVEAEPDPETAYRNALRKMGGGVLFCAGSLYLAGAILSAEERKSKDA